MKARPVHFLAIALFCLFVGSISICLVIEKRDRALAAQNWVIEVTVAGLGLTDLCISTEARYTRHPAVSDPVSPFMDYPGSYEHFPTGSFWAPMVQH